MLLQIVDTGIEPNMLLFLFIVAFAGVIAIGLLASRLG
jgi:hypothetical protein